MSAAKIKNEMLEAAGLLAEGKSAAEVAKELGRSETTIRRWMRDEAIREAYREAILRTALVSYARAIRKLSDQVDADNEAVAQRAAKDVIDRFGVSVQMSQVMLFVYLGSAALGTIIGGPIGDRIGAKAVIWISILGVLPFTLALPYASREWTIVLSAIIGLVLASAFPAIVVLAQELVPGRVGMVAGIFFGLAFGTAAVAAALLGIVADAKGIGFVYWLCSFMPMLGLLTVFLPNLRRAPVA